MNGGFSAATERVGGDWVLPPCAGACKGELGDDSHRGYAPNQGLIRGLTQGIRSQLRLLNVLRYQIRLLTTRENLRVPHRCKEVRPFASLDCPQSQVGRHTHETANARRLMGEGHSATH
jgi:hypothetical protein